MVYVTAAVVVVALAMASVVSLVLEAGFVVPYLCNLYFRALTYNPS